MMMMTLHQFDALHIRLYTNNGVINQFMFLLFSYAQVNALCICYSNRPHINVVHAHYVGIYGVPQQRATLTELNRKVNLKLFMSATVMSLLRCWVPWS